MYLMLCPVIKSGRRVIHRDPQTLRRLSREKTEALFGLSFRAPFRCKVKTSARVPRTQVTLDTRETQDFSKKFEAARNEVVFIGGLLFPNWHNLDGRVNMTSYFHLEIKRLPPEVGGNAIRQAQPQTFEALHGCVLSLGLRTPSPSSRSFLPPIRAVYSRGLMRQVGWYLGRASVQVVAIGHHGEDEHTSIVAPPRRNYADPLQVDIPAGTYHVALGVPIVRSCRRPKR